jgi:hypothetical protein
MQEWLTFLLLGALFGLVGQGLRVVVGMKKISDTAADRGTSFSAEFKSSVLITSLIVGACMGALSFLAISDPQGFEAAAQAPDKAKQLVFSVIAAGYAGTDFVEGLVKRYLPGTKSPGSAGGRHVLTEQAVG